jgi:hypothetical protein
MVSNDKEPLFVNHPFKIGAKLFIESTHPFLLIGSNTTELKAASPM